MVAKSKHVDIEIERVPVVDIDDPELGVLMIGGGNEPAHHGVQSPHHHGGQSPSPDLLLDIVVNKLGLGLWTAMYFAQATLSE